MSASDNLTLVFFILSQFHMIFFSSTAMSASVSLALRLLSTAFMFSVSYNSFSSTAVSASDA